MEELTNKLLNEMETIWDKAYGPESKYELETVFEMYEELDTYWRDKFENASFWLDGYNIICEGLGDAYFMFNTDGPEQNDVIYRLIKLVENHSEERVVKELINKIKLDKIKEDF